ncbi:Ankyrin and armadillo repeat-containing protein [Bagarius yarrelli]|uniref:Ankyrin and armadillo repeat-containing protein n=1 Tax=Bagarius yarrelli TaxID=175774 RepID=A0A556V6A7_BAGYA|nr:Ankyrin and armadillo repeat-containing protein [Bagarius yarrelli]
MDYRVVHQIIRELTVGIYCFNQVPSISLEPNPDQSSVCHLTPAYCDTKVGQILINIDYTMKALWHGAYIPKDKRPCFLELWRSSVVDVSDDPCYHGIYDEDTHNPDPTYDPDSADEQKLFYQYAENILLKLTSYLTSVRQHENLFTYEGTHNLSNVVRLTEDTLELSKYQRLQQRLSRHMELVKKHLGRKVELARDLAYLKLISFLVPFLISLKKKRKIPDLSQMLPPFSDDMLKTEREMPPLHLGSNFSCKHFPYKPNQYFHLHGGIEVDVGTPELKPITEEMKVVFVPLQNHAVIYLKDLLQQDLTYREHLPIPVSEIHGKSYSVISVALASFYPQPNSVQWWETINKTIRNLREHKLPLSDFQLYEQFKKTFGYAKAVQCKARLTPLHLAAQCGSLEALDCLIALQADYTLTDRRGWQAVHFSAFYGQVSCVQALCRTDPGLMDICTSAEYRSSPLLLSAMSGSLEMLDFLLSNGANWRLMDSEGNNVVQLAALYFHINILRRLIQLNLDGLSVWRILVEMLECEENQHLEMALRSMEALCVNADPFWKHILDAGGIAVLVDILLNKRLLFQRMAAAVLCHMTKNVPVCEEMVGVGAVPVLIKQLIGRHPELSSRCTVLLTDLAAHSGTYQTQIAEMAGVAPVVQLLTSDLQDVLVNAVRCIRALCVTCSQNQTAVALSGAIPLLDLICGAGAVTCVVQVLSSRKTSNRVKAARAVEALSQQNPVIQEHFLNQSTTRYLLRLLKVFDQDVREQGATALWALAGHTRKQQKFISELIGYRLILDLLLSTSDKMQYVGKAVGMCSGSGSERARPVTACTIPKSTAQPLEALVNQTKTFSAKLSARCQAVIALSRDCCAHQNGLCQENGVPPLVHVSQTLARILLGNKELQTTFWEREDFSYSVILQLLQAPDRSIRLEAGHALALFAYNNPNQQLAIKKAGRVPVQSFHPFLNSDDETERAKAAFQTVVLAKVISGSDQVTLTARGVTVLVRLLQSDTNTTVIIAAEFLASLVHTRAGIPDAVVTLGAMEHLCAHLYSKDQEVQTACAGALGYLSFNRFAHRLLLVECRKHPDTYRTLIDNLAKDANICCKFTSEFDRQRKLGLPSLRYHQ